MLSIAIFDALLDHRVWNDPDPWVVKMFMWCLLKAEKKDRIVLGRKVYRGQFMASRSTAADELRIDQNKWYRLTQKLKEYGSVTIDSTSSATVITVVNYSKYQVDVASPDGAMYPSPPGGSGSGAEQLVAKFKFPPMYDRPHVKEAVRNWAEHFWNKESRRVTDLKLLNALEISSRNGWDADKLVHAIQFSISVDAKSWRDPANDFDRKPKTRREHMSEPASSVLADSIRGGA